MKKRAQKNEHVSPSNALSRKMIEPYGENELCRITLEDLWKKATSGDEHCPRYTEYGLSNDMNYVGYALSRSMKNLLAAMKHLQDDNEAGQIIDANIYKKVKKEIEGLCPHVQRLSGGQMRKECARLNAYVAMPVDANDAETSAKAVYKWLSEKSTLRSLLMFLSKGGVFYTAFANEKLTRAYLLAENVGETQFVELCKLRLCGTPSSGAAIDSSTDWASIKKGMS